MFLRRSGRAPVLDATSRQEAPLAGTTGFVAQANGPKQHEEEHESGGDGGREKKTPVVSQEVLRCDTLK